MSDIHEHPQLSSILQISKTEKKNLREKAQECERESKRLHEESKVLSRKIGTTHTQHQKQYFKTLWSLLSKNDPGVTSVGLWVPGKTGHFSFPNGYGKQLGQALQRNTQVTSIGLSFDSLFPKNKDVSKLVIFLEQSKFLRHVELYGNTEHEEDADKIAVAIAANPRIERLACKINENIPSASFHHFMTSSAESIQELVVDRRVLWGAPDDTETIVDAFSKASGLTCLKLGIGFGHECIEYVLRKLHQIKSPLCELQLMADEMDMNVLSAFLQNTPSMRHFGLGCFNFDGDGDDIETLLSGLKHQGGATTLCKLSFTRCTFNTTALGKLVNFMHTPTKSASGDVLYQSSLREMHFAGTRYQPFLDGEGKVLSSMLSLPPSNDDAPLATIGSQVEVLSLSTIRDPQVHMCEMTQHTQSIALSTLKLEGVEGADFLPVYNDVLKLSSVRVLSLKQDDSHIPSNRSHEMLERLRENESLHHVECEIYGGTSMFNETETRLVSAFCERNKRLGALLGSDAVEPVSDDGSTAGMNHDPLDCGAAATVSELADRLLYPTLAGTAMQTPNNCPTALIKSLLVRDESMVPSASEVESKISRGTKRARSRPVALSALKPADDAKPRAKGPSKKAPKKRRK